MGKDQLGPPAIDHFECRPSPPPRSLKRLPEEILHSQRVEKSLESMVSVHKERVNAESKMLKLSMSLAQEILVMTALDTCLLGNFQRAKHSPAVAMKSQRDHDVMSNQTSTHSVAD